MWCYPRRLSSQSWGPQRALNTDYDDSLGEFLRPRTTIITNNEDVSVMNNPTSSANFDHNVRLKRWYMFSNFPTDSIFLLSLNVQCYLDKSNLCITVLSIQLCKMRNNFFISKFSAIFYRHFPSTCDGANKSYLNCVWYTLILTITNYTR